MNAPYPRGGKHDRDGEGKGEDEMRIDKMSKADFKKVRVRNWEEDIGEFDAVVIIPGNSRDLHDSGYRHITYCLCKNNEPVCLTSGGSDVIHLNGIGGYGANWVEKYGTVPRLVPPAAWNMDCLPKTGYLRLWDSQHNLTCGVDLSSFEVYVASEVK